MCLKLVTVSWLHARYSATQNVINVVCLILIAVSWLHARYSATQNDINVAVFFFHQVTGLSLFFAVMSCSLILRLFACS